MEEVPDTVRIKKATIGWAVIWAFVIGFDYGAIKTGNETLSRAYWRAVKHPKAKWPTLLVTMSLFKHLLFPNFLPQLDPLNKVAENWHRKA